MFVCMDAPLKMYALLASVLHTQIIIYWVENRILAFVRFPKLVPFQIHPPLNIFIVPNWLSVKFHHFLIGPKVKIFSTLPPLAPTNSVSRVVTRVNPLRVLLVFLNMQA